MTSKIWDEKPVVQIGMDAPTSTYRHYIASEMDEWLEKVKAESDELQSYNKTLDSVYTEACGEIVELQMKLEAIKTWWKFEIDEWEQHRLHFSAYKLQRERLKRLLKLMELLEIKDDRFRKIPEDEE